LGIASFQNSNDMMKKNRPPITDVQGRIRLVAPVQGNPLQIPVYELPNGAYFVSIRSENAVVAVTRLNILK